MGMYEWAQKEVEAACERERKLAGKDGKPGGADYGVFCYKSALRAYKSLCDDGHTGMSLQITKSILSRLIACKPLTPIEDTEGAWNLVGEDIVTGVKSYQHTRMGGLFKHVAKDGTVTYSDTERALLLEMGSNTIWYSSFGTRLVNTMYPISMPYMPPDKPYTVEVYQYLADPSAGDYDTMVVEGVRHPDGAYTRIHKFYKCPEHEWVEIGQEEFEARKAKHMERLK